MVRRYLAALFPLEERPRYTRMTVIWGILAVIAGTIVSLARTTGPGPFNTIFAEDGVHFLHEALNRGTFEAVIKPVNGYFMTVPRLLAEVASLFPISWQPAVLTTETALITALMAYLVYIASAAHLKHPVARFIATAPVVLSPVAETVLYSGVNNVATLQFASTYAVMWVLLWVPATRPARIIAIGVVVAAAFSTFLTFLLIPLALTRLYVRRDWTSVSMVAGLVLSAGLNVLALALHWTVRPGIVAPRYEPLWALKSSITYALPQAMFGYRLTTGHVLRWFIIAAAAILLVAVIVAALGITRPAWLLALVFGLQAIGYFSTTTMSYGAPIFRYLVGPGLMLFAALAALLIPRPGAKWRGLAPIMALAIFVMAIAAIDYRQPSHRSMTYPWSKLVDNARVVCQDLGVEAVYAYSMRNGTIEPVPAGEGLPEEPPGWFPVRIPCKRLTDR